MLLFVTIKTKIMSIQKKCVVCGNNFIAKNDKGIYCSPSCRVKAHRKREKEGKAELNKTISEEYAAELSFFRAKFSNLFEEVEKLKTDMAVVTKYLYSFSSKIAEIPNNQGSIDIKNRIEDLSDRFDREIYNLKSENTNKINRNEDNIKFIGFKINEFADAINRINENYVLNNSRTNMLDKILSEDKISKLIDVFINTKSPKAVNNSEM